MKENWVDGLADIRGGFLGLLDGFSHVGRANWCSRDPRRALIAAIIRWATARAGTIGGPEWTDVGLHALHARPVRTPLGCHERYRLGGNGGLFVSGVPLLTASQTAFSHLPLFRFLVCPNCVSTNIKQELLTEPTLKFMWEKYQQYPL